MNLIRSFSTGERKGIAVKGNSMHKSRSIEKHRERTVGEPGWKW